MKLVIGAVLLIVGILFRRMTRRDARQVERNGSKAAGTSTSRPDFHAVSIRPGTDPCSAALDLQGHRVLPSDAPSLPLPECVRSECTCRFIHHEDRRAIDDRRSPYPSSIGLDPGSIGEEQRKRPDRRQRQ